MSYAARDSELIVRLFGKGMVERWRPAQRLYDRANVRRAQFKFYPGVGHEVTPEIRNDITAMFRKALGTQSRSTR